MPSYRSVVNGLIPSDTVALVSMRLIMRGKFLQHLRTNSPPVLLHAYAKLDEAVDPCRIALCFFSVSTYS